MAISKPISALLELLGLHAEDLFAIVDTTVTPWETKKIRAATLIEAVASNRFYAEARVPTAQDGSLTDLWIHTVTGLLYEKTAAGWIVLGSLRGPKGEDGVGKDGRDGSLWYAEPRPPSDTEGLDGDFFMDTRSGNIYKKVAGSWGTPVINVHNAPEWEGPADKVSYALGQFPELKDVRAALDQLFAEVYYVAPVILTLAHNRNGSYDIGRTVDTVRLDWTLNKQPTTQTVNGVPTASPGDRTVTLTGPFTTNQTWTLVVGDGKNTVSRSVSMGFYPRRYWGTSADPALVDITELNGGELASARAQTRTMDGRGEYLYFAYPAAWGPASFNVNGLANTAWTERIVSHTNNYGYTQDYRVYRTDTVQFGSGLQIQVL